MSSQSKDVLCCDSYVRRVAAAPRAARDVASTPCRGFRGDESRRRAEALRGAAADVARRHARRLGSVIQHSESLRVQNGPRSGHRGGSVGCREATKEAAAQRKGQQCPDTKQPKRKMDQPLNEAMAASLVRRSVAHPSRARPPRTTSRGCAVAAARGRVVAASDNGARTARTNRGLRDAAPGCRAFPDAPSNLRRRPGPTAFARTTGTDLPLRFPLTRLLAGLAPWLENGPGRCGLREHDLALAPAGDAATVAVVADPRGQSNC